MRRISFAAKLESATKRGHYCLFHRRLFSRLSLIKLLVWKRCWYSSRNTSRASETRVTHYTALLRQQYIIVPTTHMYTLLSGFVFQNSLYGSLINDFRSVVDTSIPFFGKAFCWAKRIQAPHSALGNLTRAPICEPYETILKSGSCGPGGPKKEPCPSYLYGVNVWT